MKNIIKKNQIVVFVIGLMIIAAGYLSYTNNESNNSTLETGVIADSEEMASIGDAKLVSANVAEENAIANSITENNSGSNISTNSNEIVNNINETNTNSISTNTISNTVETATITVDEYFTNSRLERDTMYSKINNEQNAIMIAENLIKTKGIEDLVIFVNGDSINVIVKGDGLEKEEIAQIQNIITRELEADIANIHIMNK